MKYNRYTFPFIGAALLAAILFFFRLPVSQLLNVVIVKPLFADFERGAWADVILMLVLLTVAVWMAKEQHLKSLFRQFLYGLIFFCFQRANAYWSFTSTVLLPQLAYWDMVALALAIPLLLYFLFNRKVAASLLDAVNQGFIEDNVVTRLEDDHFKRMAAASEIAQLIQLTDNQKSFAIGILGEYGSGKTSFLNLVNFKLEDKQVLKIAFNPWSAGSPEMIRREFFDLLAREVTSVDLKISSLIYSYGRKLASFDTRSLSWLNWLGFFRNHGSVQSSGEYEQINKMLRATHRKIVITIDDLDRLYPPEIIEVLKLIRNTADFSNVFYLVGYDKEYVQGAIKILSDTGGLNYLDKIFQLEIPLPKREEDDLLIMLQEHLKKIILENHYAIFESVMIPNGFRSRYEKAYNGILRQARDVVRFLNGFKIVYRLIGEEVDFQCLLILELIKFRFPLIYELIYNQSDLFLYENPVRSTHEQYFAPRMMKAKDAEKASDEVSIFRQHIEKMQWFSAEDVSLLDGLFMTLFQGSQYHQPNARNSISYPLYFDIYFRYRISQKDLSDKDYKAAIASNHMKKYMEYCASNSLHKELMIRFMQEDISKDRTYFEKVIRWIFSFGRTCVEKEGMFRFDYNALVDKIRNDQNVVTDKLYKKDVNPYADLIKRLFSNALAPFLFENELLYHLKKKVDHFVVSMNELTAHQLSYFTRMAESSHGLSEDTLWLFWGAREYYKVPADDKGAYYEHWRFEAVLVDKMKGYLKYKDPRVFLKFSIQQDIRDRSLVYIHKEVMAMFDEPTEYRKLIEDNPALDDDIKREYLILFDKLSAQDFKQYVEIELKTDLQKTEVNI